MLLEVHRLTFDLTLKTNERGKIHSLGITEGENYTKNYVRPHILTVLLWTICCLHPEEVHNC